MFFCLDVDWNDCKWKTVTKDPNINTDQLSGKMSFVILHVSWSTTRLPSLKRNCRPGSQCFLKEYLEDVVNFYIILQQVVRLVSRRLEVSQSDSFTWKGLSIFAAVAY